MEGTQDHAREAQTDDLPGDVLWLKVGDGYVRMYHPSLSLLPCKLCRNKKLPLIHSESLLGLSITMCEVVFMSHLL